MKRDELAPGTALGAEAHASADELLAFVLDVLEPAARRTLERHVGGCGICARALAGQAAVEVALGDAWAGVPRPLAPGLSFALPRPVRAPDPADVETRAVPAVAPSPRTARRVWASNSWGNGLAAAMLTVLFVGYWHEGGRAHAPVVAAAPVGEGADLALCAREPFTPATLPAGEDAERMCTSPRPPVSFERAGLCQADDRACWR
jgi:hypothetical protein